jgi:hypothetical protein
MRRIRRLFGTAALSVFAMVVWALPAQAAATHGSANCVINGTATVNPPVKLLGGSGSYHFTEFRALCAVTTDETGPGGSPATGVVSLDITSDGTYNNSVCGTGTADDTALVGPDFAAPSVTATEEVVHQVDSASVYTGTPGAAARLFSSGDYGYHIVFDGLNNATFHLLFVHTDSSKAAVSGGGTIQLLPTPSGPQASGDCTDGFQVGGHINASL